MSNKPRNLPIGHSGVIHANRGSSGLRGQCCVGRRRAGGCLDRSDPERQLGGLLPERAGARCEPLHDLGTLAVVWSTRIGTAESAAVLFVRSSPRRTSAISRPARLQPPDAPRATNPASSDRSAWASAFDAIQQRHRERRRYAAPDGHELRLRPRLRLRRRFSNPFLETTYAIRASQLGVPCSVLIIQNPDPASYTIAVPSTSGTRPVASSARAASTWPRRTLSCCKRKPLHRGHRLAHCHQ